MTTRKSGLQSWIDPLGSRSQPLVTWMSRGLNQALRVAASRTPFLTGGMLRRPFRLLEKGAGPWSAVTDVTAGCRMLPARERKGKMFDQRTGRAVAGLVD